MKPRAERTGGSWLLFLTAPIVWFAHFSALYGIATFAGLASGGSLGFKTIAWTLTGLACAAVGAVWFLSRRSLGDMTAWLALLSLAGILFQSLPLVLMPS